VGVRTSVAVAFDAVPARVKELVRRLGRTSLGKNLIHASVLRDPATMRFPNVERWPEDVRGFEDLAFLFSSNQLNHGVASLQFDEAALLYGLGRDATTGPAYRAERRYVCRGRGYADLVLGCGEKTLRGTVSLGGCSA